MRLPQLRRAAVLTVTALTIATTTSACFGSFNVTRKAWMFNRDVSKNKFVREIVFLGMNIVPVYGIAAFVDVVVANTVEFWTGTNPVTMASRTKVGGQTVQSVVYEADGARTMVIRGFAADSLAWMTTMNLVPGTDMMEFKTRFAGGRMVSRVVAMDADGKPYLISSSESR
jgi:hypothetical protein